MEPYLLEEGLCPIGDLGFAVLDGVTLDGQTGGDSGVGAGILDVLFGICHAAALVGAQGDDPLAA